MRGDSLYCPLSFSLDAWWNCLNDCWHCYLRRLNQTWSRDLRPTDPEETARKLTAGLKNKHPRTALAWAIAQKKTLRFGNKTDPFQHEAERKHHTGRELLKVLRDLRWEAVIQTMETATMMEYEDLLCDETGRECFIIQPIISPGAERDWVVLERERTTPVQDRLLHLKKLKAAGLRVAVNGEPFIPGYHTVNEFEEMCRRLKSAGIDTYNTYNFHMNEFVIKRLHKIGLDVMRIWEMNQDKNWRPIHQRLCDIAKAEGIYLGCPDFVNTGPNHHQTRNTCCGVDVSRPTTFNTHFFKQMIQAGFTNPEKIEARCWDGIGDPELGGKILRGIECGFFTMAEAGLVSPTKKRFDKMSGLFR
jgi:DNA repair photolyase